MLPACLPICTIYHFTCNDHLFIPTPVHLLQNRNKDNSPTLCLFSLISNPAVYITLDLKSRSRLVYELPEGFHLKIFASAVIWLMKGLDLPIPLDTMTVPTLALGALASSVGFFSGDSVILQSRWIQKLKEEI